MSNQPKSVWITGAARGIGLAMVDHFKTNGWNVLAMDLSDRVLELDKAPNVRAFQGDVTQQKDCQSVIHGAKDEFSNLTALINNAGILKDRSLLKMSEEEFDDVVRVNLKGVFLCGQAFAQHLVKQKTSGAIVNMSSLARHGIYGQTNYAATKAGVAAMTKTWALELAKHGIRVNAIAPGLVKTEMTDTIPDDVKAKMISAIPLGRMAQVQEIAGLAHFLCSEDASYVQGEVWEINGGLHM